MKIVQNGLNLYPMRDLDDEYLHKYSNLPFSLPVIYELFLNTYKLGKSQKKSPVEYLDLRYNEFLGLTRIEYKPDPDYITFGNLFTLEESLEIMSRVFSEDKEIEENELLVIGEDGTGHYFFMVGLGDQNRDQIFVESADLSFSGDSRFTKLANNIFDFMRSFNRIEIDEGIGYGVEYDQLYKNWGEDFWRVRED